MAKALSEGVTETAGPTFALHPKVKEAEETLFGIWVAADEAIREIVSILPLARDTKALLSGPPGAGKSVLIEGIGKTYFGGEVIGKVQADPSLTPDDCLYKLDLAKLIRGEDEKVVPRRVVTSRLKWLNEFARANNVLQDAFLGLLSEREVEYRDQKFTSPNFLCLADYNPAELGGEQDLSWPIADRFDALVEIPTLSLLKRVSLTLSKYQGKHLKDLRGSYSNVLTSEEMQSVWDDVEKVTVPQPVSVLTEMLMEAITGCVYDRSRVSTLYKEKCSVGRCVPPDTLIIGNPSAQMISTIKVGDSVFTHTGKFQKVTQVLSRPYNGPLMNIRTRLSSSPVRLTPEHRLLVRRVEKCRYDNVRCLPRSTGCRCRRAPSKQLPPPQWVEAKDVTRYDYLLYPVPSYDTKDTRVLRLEEWTKKPFTTTIVEGRKYLYPYEHAVPEAVLRYVSRNKNYRRFWEAERKFGINRLKIRLAYFASIGRFRVGNKRLAKLPQGSARAVVPTAPSFMRIAGLYLAEGYISENDVVFCFGTSEKEKALALDTQKRIKEKFWVTPRIVKVRTGTLVVVGNRLLASAFKNLFGTGALNKHLPQWMMQLPLGKVQALVDGYWDGDGFKCADKKVVTSVSGTLIFQIRDLLLRLGELPSLTTRAPRKAPLLGRSVNTHTQYLLTVPSHRKPWRGFVQDGFVHVPVRSVRTFDYDGIVHNLEVEGDNSYCTTYSALHNCAFWNEVCSKIERPASFRATDALVSLGKARAWREKRTEISVDDILFLFPYVLAHRAKVKAQFLLPYGGDTLAFYKKEVNDTYEAKAEVWKRAMGYFYEAFRGNKDAISKIRDMADRDLAVKGLFANFEEHIVEILNELASSKGAFTGKELAEAEEYLKLLSGGEAGSLLSQARGTAREADSHRRQGQLPETRPPEARRDGTECRVRGLRGVPWEEVRCGHQHRRRQAFVH